MKTVQIRSFFWSLFSHIRTEYGEIRSISPYSVRMRENTDQKKLCIWALFMKWSEACLVPWQRPMMKPHEKIVNNKELLNIFQKKNIINIWWCPKYTSERQQKFTLSWRKSLLYRKLRHEKIYTLKDWPPFVVFLKMYLLKRGWNAGFSWLLILS